MLIGTALIGLVTPAVAQEIPIIHSGQTYYFSDATAGFASSAVPPFSDAAFDLSAHRARTWVDIPYTSTGTWSTAWVGKTVQIADASSYRFEVWGHYHGLVSACGIADADLWFHARVLDVSTNEVVGDTIVAQFQTAICYAYGGNSDFHAYMDVGIPSARVNHQFNIQVESVGFVEATPGSGISDAWAVTDVFGNPLNPPRGISYSQIKIGPKPTGGGGCLASGTSIQLPDGSTSRIDKLRAGDQVMGYDVLTSTLLPVTVTANLRSTVDHVLVINNGTLTTTFTDQPLWIRNATYTGWLTDPQDLRVGTELFNPVTQTWTIITVLSTTWTMSKVYDLRVSSPYTFVANGILVLDKQII